MGAAGAPASAPALDNKSDVGGHAAPGKEPGADDAPADPGAPGAGDSQGEPAMPADGDMPAMPPDGDMPAMPADGGMPAMPADGGMPAMPADGGMPAMPADGGMPAMPADGSEPTTPTAADAGTRPMPGGEPGSPTTPPASPPSSTPPQHVDPGGASSGEPGGGGPVAADSGTPATPATPAIGRGSIDAPVVGPVPTLAADKRAGTGYTLVKNWDFGADGNIRDNTDLIAEFQFHDQFGTIANGTHYGAVMVAPTAETAIRVKDLGLPDDQQPVEDPARPVREWTHASLVTHVLPLSATQKEVHVAKHDTGCGSFVSKWTLPNGGKHLAHDLLWETRVRMTTPTTGYWFALWTAGSKWNRGAEMDVLESFGTKYIRADAFHVNSVGGVDEYDYANWYGTLGKLGVTAEQSDLSQWHTFTWVYLKDDSFVVYDDGQLVQRGTLHWTYTGDAAAEPVNMTFLFDFTWGHTDVPDLSLTVPAATFELTYEIDYSRVYLR
jgi:hypothetical protein